MVHYPNGNYFQINYLRLYQKMSDVKKSAQLKAVCCAIGSKIPNCQQRYELARSFKGLSQHERRAEFFKNFCAFPFKEVLSTDT